MEKREKKVIGITGGVGAGKSSVLNILKTKFGARIILADLVARDLMEPGTEGLCQVTKALGTGFLREDGLVDRKALADLIFHDPEALTIINSIIHPMVWEAIKTEVKEAKESLILVEAAVFTTAPGDFFDELWYVHTDKENRIRRLMESRGYSREKCESIIKSQKPDSWYKSFCGRVIDNNGTEEETEKQLKEILGHEIC